MPIWDFFTVSVVLLATFTQTPPPLTPPLASSVYVLDLDNDGVRLTSASQGVRFDIEADGKPVPVGWTTAGVRDALLCLDINTNGSIDSAAELIGTRTTLPEGRKVPGIAEALNILQGLVRGPDGRLPQPLPHGSAVIDAEDAIYAKLLLWTDSNHDGRSQPSELESLASAGVEGISMGYRRDRTTDEGGNEVLLRGTFAVSGRGMQFQRELLVVSLSKASQ